MRAYTTREIAESVGIHPNTVRFYEEIGFLTPPARRANGYRVYTALHLAECRLVRLAMRAEVLQHGLREKAVEIVRLSASLDFPAALHAASDYQAMIVREMESAKAAITTAAETLACRVSAAAPLTRPEAARALGVTPETVRTWERSGLLGDPRYEAGRRVYAGTDMERLNVIRALRCANYSLSSILRLLRRLDANASCSMEAVLNTPGPDEDIVSVCDRLILSLCDAASDAEQIVHMITQLQTLSQTIQ